MIDKETPYKMAEIIRDTWPNLHRIPEKNIKKGDEESKDVDTKENS
jgi:hypothetical protein